MAGAPQTILFGWELGANLGHLMPMRTVMREVAKAGHNIVVAARDLTHIAVLQDGLDFKLFQAPVWPSSRRAMPSRMPSSYTDILGNTGFAEPDRVAVVLQAWDSLIEKISPDLVIADHSPGLLLSLYGSDIPVIAVGTGYTMPPNEGQRFPPLNPELSPTYMDSDILVSVKRVLTARGRPLPQTLPNAFASARRAVFSLAEFDPYTLYRIEDVLLPPETAPVLTPPPVKANVFAYLSPDIPGLEVLVQALSRLDMPVTAFIRGDAGPAAAFLELRGHKVLKTPPEFSAVLPSASHVISTAGAYTCQAALLAGRPHLMIPLHQETSLNASTVEGLAAGIRINMRGSDAEIAGQIVKVITGKTLSATAYEAGKRLSARPQKDGKSVVTQWVRELLADSNAAAG